MLNFTKQLKKIIKLTTTISSTLATVIAYSGRFFFTVSSSLTYLGLKNPTANKILSSAAIICESSVVTITRGPGLYRLLGELDNPATIFCPARKNLSPHEDDTKKRILINTGTSIVGISGIINGIAPNILLSFLGTKFLLNAIGEKDEKITNIICSVIIVANFLTYAGFSFKKGINNAYNTINRIYNLFQMNREDRRINKTAIAGTAILSSAWAVSCGGLSFYNLRSAIDETPIICNMTEHNKLTIAGALAANFTFQYYVTRLIDLYERLAKLATQQTQLEAIQPKSKSLVNIAVTTRAIVGYTHLALYAVSYFRGTLDLCEHIKIDPAQWSVKIVAGFTALSATIVERFFVYAMMRDELDLHCFKDSKIGDKKWQDSVAKWHSENDWFARCKAKFFRCSIVTEDNGETLPLVQNHF